MRALPATVGFSPTLHDQQGCGIVKRMATQTLTLKVPFLRLNAAKATEFARLQDLNTQVANDILALSQEERSDLTTAHFTDVEIGSAWMNQTIRNARARTKAKRFRVMLLETNNQNWTLHKVVVCAGGRGR